MTSRLVAGLRTLLEPLPVYDGDVTRPVPDQYVVLYPDGGREAEVRLAAPSARVTVTTQVMCVGRTRDGVRQLVRQVRERLLRVPPTTAASVLAEGLAGPILEDNILGERRYTLTLEYICNIPQREL